MDLFLKRCGTALWPDGDESVVELSKLPLDQSLHAVIRRPRSLQQHKLFWTLVHRIANGIGADPETVCDVLKIATGHCTIVISKNYGELRMPRSIAFANMDQDKFSEFFERAIQVVFEEWGIPQESLADLIVPPTN